jgi:hypothetical protein
VSNATRMFDWRKLSHGVDFPFETRLCDERVQLINMGVLTVLIET